MSSSDPKQPLSPAAALDIDAYCERTGYRGPRAATEDALIGLHVAQATTIPFENLDIHLGNPIRLDVASLAQKLVHGRRGGYCYELNGLLREVLTTLGFRVTCHTARTLMGAPPGQPFPKTHMVLLVDVGGRRWIADLGFGAFGLLAPVPLDLGVEHRQHGDTYRVCPDDNHGQRLQVRVPDGWQDLYGFTLEAFHPVDFQVLNYFNSTSKDSRFTHRRVVALVAPEARYSVVELDYKVRRGDEVTVTRLDDEGAYLELLESRFGIRLPPGTSFDRQRAPQ